MSGVLLFEIAPDGDVDLIVEHQPWVDHLDDLFKDVNPTRLNFRRWHEKQPQCTATVGNYALQPEWEPDSWVCDEKPQENGSEESEPDLEVEENLAVSEELTNSTSNESCWRIRVSSKHLLLASAYFRRNLKSGMLESHTLTTEGHVDIHMKDQDARTMDIVMNIIHGRYRHVQFAGHWLDVNGMTRLAVLVDYLECHEAVEPLMNI